METMEGRTLEQFIQENGLELRNVEQVSSNPNMNDDEWARTATHWTVTIAKPDADGPTWSGMTLYFSQGSALTEPPTLADVLDSVASDASGVLDTDFEDWCSEYGYSDDSIKALHTYNTIKEQRDHLERVIGADALEDLILNVERL